MKKSIFQDISHHKISPKTQPRTPCISLSFGNSQGPYSRNDIACRNYRPRTQTHNVYIYQTPGETEGMPLSSYSPFPSVAGNTEHKYQCTGDSVYNLVTSTSWYSRHPSTLLGTQCSARWPCHMTDRPRSYTYSHTATRNSPAHSPCTGRCICHISCCYNVLDISGRTACRTFPRDTVGSPLSSGHTHYSPLDICNRISHPTRHCGSGDSFLLSDCTDHPDIGHYTSPCSSIPRDQGGSPCSVLWIRHRPYTHQHSPVNSAYPSCRVGILQH